MSESTNPFRLDGEVALITGGGSGLGFGIAQCFAVINTHVLSAFRLTRLIAPAMLAAGKGSILFTASMSALMGMPSIVAYSTAKAAYLGMVRALTAEFAPRGVRVNAIAPGW